MTQSFTDALTSFGRACDLKSEQGCDTYATFKKSCSPLLVPDLGRSLSNDHLWGEHAPPYSMSLRREGLYAT